MQAPWLRVFGEEIRFAATPYGRFFLFDHAPATMHTIGPAEITRSRFTKSPSKKASGHDLLPQVRQHLAGCDPGFEW
jgi:hypothetical protein